MNAVEHVEVKRIAKLARLQLTPDEIQSLSHQLTDILQYVEQLESVDTTDVQPLSHVQEMVNNLRRDEVKPSLSREEALRNSPDTDGSFFLVPKVIKE